jgi:ribosomal-protein-alanine N-acetyltransferase
MEITGTGFVLRPWEGGDASSMRRHADNPNVSNYLMDRFPCPYSMEDAHAWLNWVQQHEQLVNMAIVVNGKAVGGIGLEFRKDIYRKTPLLGYWLGEQFWGNGIMTEVVQLFTNYAFTHLDVMCIHAVALSKNPRSIRVLEKAGYEKQGILRKSVIKLGEVLDEHVYASLSPNHFK